MRKSKLSKISWVKFLKDPVYLTLIVIFILAAAVRFYRLPEMAPFDFDQEYAANFAYNVLKVYPIQLIGQNLSVAGLFMGPGYFYYLVPFFAASNLHPIGGAVGSVVFGLVTVLAYFFIAKKMFGVRAGLVAAFLRAISYREIEHDWAMVPSYASDLIAITTWFLFYKYWKGETKFLPILTFLFGLYTSIHPIMFPFFGVFVLLVLIKRKLPSLKTGLLSVVTFLVPLSPLILFEFLHSFLEVKRFLGLLEGEGSAVPKSTDYLATIKPLLVDPSRLLAFDFMPKEIISIPILIIAAVFVFFKVKGNLSKYSFHLVMLPVTFVVFIGYYLALPTHITEYYFYGLMTLTTLYMSAFLGQLTYKKLLWPVMLGLLVNVILMNFVALNRRWNNPSLSTLAHKDKIVKEILKVQPKNEEFFVSYIKEPGWNFGFDYLFKMYGQVPQTIEARPPVYSIVVPANLVRDGRDITSGNVGLILPKEN